MAEMILPGVYIEVRPEALIVSGQVSVGNVGIVGTASPPATVPPAPLRGVIGKVYELSSYAEAKEEFGAYDPFDNPTTPDSPLTLTRGIELAFSHGARKVLAVRVDTLANFAVGLEALSNEDAHIIVVPGSDAETAGAVLKAHCETASSDLNKHDRIAIVGSRQKGANESVTDFFNAIKASPIASDDGRVVYVAPGVITTETAETEEGGLKVTKVSSVTLPGTYAAAAIAGILSSRSAHISLTNKPLSVKKLEVKFNPGQLESLIGDDVRVLALEERNGPRVVRGITTSTNSAWRQITTRRIVDYAKFGVRSAAQPYIGLLNNDRVRKALKGSINGFLAGMVEDEMVTFYELDVTAARDDEIRGIAKVIMTLQPTFSIDYIKVVMYLQ
jgi:hypothetical protein